MIRYTVIWHQSALEELTRLWLAARDRRSITTAADSIDGQLSRDANVKGVLVEDGLRELSVPPLCVLFSVSEPDRMVKVLTVHLV